MVVTSVTGAFSICAVTAKGPGYVRKIDVATGVCTWPPAVATMNKRPSSSAVRGPNHHSCIISNTLGSRCVDDALRVKVRVTVIVPVDDVVIGWEFVIGTLTDTLPVGVSDDDRDNKTVALKVHVTELLVVRVIEVDTIMETDADSLSLTLIDTVCESDTE